MKSEYLAIGRIKKPHGTKGEVKVDVLTDYPDKIKPGLEVYVVLPEEQKSLHITAVRSTKEELLIKFEEISDRNQAESLKGEFLQIPLESAEQLPKDTFWQHDIIGLSVFDISGNFLGKVESILRTGSNDVYEIESPQGKKILIPAIKEVVKEINLSESKIVIEPLPGLLD